MEKQSKKRNCPFCGGIINLFEHDVQIQTSSSYSGQKPERYCKFKCEKCGAEFESSFHFSGGRTIPSSERINVVSEIPSVGIMGEGRKRLW